MKLMFEIRETDLLAIIMWKPARQLAINLDSFCPEIGVIMPPCVTHDSSAFLPC